MAGLQETFYIVSIVYMGISLLLILGVVVAVFVIRAKVVSLEKMIKEKVETISSLSSKAVELVSKASRLTSHKSKSN